jgi:SET domain-containing protein
VETRHALRPACVGSEAMHEALQCELFEHHATTYAGLRILYGDDARFFNHSAKPNVAARDPISDMVARRYINIGEEMFVDYFFISDAAF